MSTGLRVLLTLMAVVSTISVIRRIRKSRMRIEYAVFWVLFSAGMVVLALFPQICYFFSGLLGIISPANFVFATIIALLLMKSFFMTAEISRLDEQVKGLTQALALQEEARKCDFAVDAEISNTKKSEQDQDSKYCREEKSPAASVFLSGAVRGEETDHV